MKVLALTVSDRLFFPGTLAAVNSLLHYHQDLDIEVAVVSSGEFGEPLSEPQIAALLRDERILVLPHSEFSRHRRVLGPWQLKAYAASDLMASGAYDLLVGFDSDLVFVSNTEDVMRRAILTGNLFGGRDGEGIDYGSEYGVYGFATPVSQAPYMSTSCYFCPRTELNLHVLEDWASKTNDAEYGPNRGIYPGHGDQGVLNAVIYARTMSKNVTLLPNELWSQHWSYEDDVIEWLPGCGLVNRSHGCLPMRTLHCGGSHKFWSPEHSRKRLKDGVGQRWSYAAFLRFLHLGALSIWREDPALLIPNESCQVYRDMMVYHQLVQCIEPDFAAKWEAIGWHWLQRLMETERQERMMSLCGDGSMDEYIRLVQTLPPRSLVLEVGSYHGGSIATLAAALLGKQHRFVSVESFSGNRDNSVDGFPLPKLGRYLANLKTKWSMLNIDTIQLPSSLAAPLFADGSIDFVFLDGDHSTDAVIRDIEDWWPKLKSGGTMAGDDIDWGSVREAVAQKFPNYQASEILWWTRK